MQTIRVLLQHDTQFRGRVPDNIHVIDGFEGTEPVCLYFAGKIRLEDSSQSEVADAGKVCSQKNFLRKKVLQGKGCQKEADTLFIGHI